MKAAWRDRRFVPGTRQLIVSLAHGVNGQNRTLTIREKGSERSCRCLCTAVTLAVAPWKKPTVHRQSEQTASSQPGLNGRLVTAVVAVVSPTDIGRFSDFRKRVELHVRRTSRSQEAATLSHVMVKIAWCLNGLCGVIALQAVGPVSTVAVVTSFACDLSMGLVAPWSLE